MKQLRITSIIFFAAVLVSSCQEKVTPEAVGNGTVDTIYVSTGTTVGHFVSIQEYGVLPGNTAEANKAALQKAIDAATKSGVGLYVTPCENGYPCEGGLVLKKNVTLLGSHTPDGKGTCNQAGDGPTGSLFVITDTKKPFITVESATRISGIQFWYPEQSTDAVNNIKKYQPTIQMSSTSSTQGVTLTDLSFYGEYTAMDFRSGDNVICEQILFENCFGYPLSGQFILIDKCYDIPRILHCHVDPETGKAFGQTFSKSVLDKVISNAAYSYWISRTDNAVVVDIDANCNHGGIYCAASTYGQLTGFNFKNVRVGIYKDGDSDFNRNWEIAQGIIHANVGSKSDSIHPVYITGYGHTSLTNVQCTSGKSDLITSMDNCYDFVNINGSVETRVSIVNCIMNGYLQGPIIVKNLASKVRAVNCIDKDGNIFNFSKGESDIVYSKVNPSNQN